MPQPYSGTLLQLKGRAGGNWTGGTHRGGVIEYFQLLKGVALKRGWPLSYFVYWIAIWIWGGPSP